MIYASSGLSYSNEGPTEAGQAGIQAMIQAFVKETYWLSCLDSLIFYLTGCNGGPGSVLGGHQL